MTLMMRAVILLALLGSNAARALSGSNAFICDLIEYSENLEEIREANLEASKRGICGYTKTVPEAVFAENPKEEDPNDTRAAKRERRGKAVFLGGAIVCIAKGKCEQPLTSTGK